MAGMIGETGVEELVAFHMQSARAEELDSRVEKKTSHKKMQGYPHFFLVDRVAPRAERARRVGRGERGPGEEAGEGRRARRRFKGVAGRRGREKEFGYRGIMPSRFLRRHLRRNARGTA